MTTAVGLLLASLLGSVHCAAMCGGFSCLYASRGGGAWPHVAYNGGRLTSYLALGVVAGAVGETLDLVGWSYGFARLAAISSGAVLVIWGAIRLAALQGWAPSRRAGGVAARFPSRIVRWARQRGQVATGAALGVASGLLPCGWLYVFVAAAAGTGRVKSAVLTMAVFWLGTLPAITGAALVLQRLTGRMRSRLPAFSAALILLIGALTLAGRLTPAVFALHSAPNGPSHDHAR